MRNERLPMKSVIIISVSLALHTSARPLRFEQPWWDVRKDPIPSPEDNPYGPVEINAYYGNYFHPPGDIVHNDDLWPNLAPPVAAAKRGGSAVVNYSPAKTPDLLAPWRPWCYQHCPPNTSRYNRCHRCPLSFHIPSATMTPETTAVKENSIIVTTTPLIQKRELAHEVSKHGDVKFPSATVIQFPTSTSKDKAPTIFTGAQQWQQYWAHSVSPFPVPTFDISARIKGLHSTLAITNQVWTVNEPINRTPISKGAQQWQAYWDQNTTKHEMLSDETKLALFAQVFAVPHHLTTAMITLSEWLAQVNSEFKSQEQNSQEPGTAAILGMCSMVGQIFPEEDTQTGNAGDLGNAITTTCKAMAQLFPGRKIRKREASPFNDRIVVKITEFFAEFAETHTTYADAIGKEMFINLMTSAGRLDKTQSYNEGILTETRTLNITAVRHHFANYKMTNRTGSPGTLPQEPRAIETHTEYANILPHIIPNVSPSASAHRPSLASRDFYPFKPLEQAYTFLNDMYSSITDQHPRHSYNPPEEQIYGCIYRPSKDTVDADRIICPPGDRDGKQRVPVRSVLEALAKRSVEHLRLGSEEEAAPAEPQNHSEWQYYKDQVLSSKKRSVVKGNLYTVQPTEFDAVPVGGERSGNSVAVPASVQKLSFLHAVKAIFGPHSDISRTTAEMAKKRHYELSGACAGMNPVSALLVYYAFGACNADNE